MRRFPWYGWVGLSLIGLMVYAAFWDIPGLDEWVTPVAWAGWILAADAAVFSLTGTSLIQSDRKPFWRMFPLSIGLWLIFEWHNLHVRNWEYIQLPENPFVLYFAYAFSFSTILPALEETAHLIRALGFPEIRCRKQAFSRACLKAEMVFGGICIAVPVLVPSPYTGPLIWLGYLFFFAPLNALMGIPGVILERTRGRMTSTWVLCAAGLFCGFLWEFLNWSAGVKWIYHVPYLEHIRLFEMPFLGYLGYFPFAIAFTEMGRFVLHFVQKPFERKRPEEFLNLY